MFEPVFYDPAMMPANPTVMIIDNVIRKSETLRRDRYDCRRKPHSTKYRYRPKCVNRMSAFMTAMDNNNSRRKAVMLERQDEFRENISNIATEIFRNTSSVINTTLGPNFYVPPIQLGGDIECQI